MDAEPFIIEFFKSIDFSIDKIPETNVKTPDFLAERKGAHYVIEHKSKFPSNEPIYPHNRLHGIIKDSKDQLASYDAPEGAFNMCWFSCHGYLDEPRQEQFESTLYGSTNSVNMDPGGKSGPCYYFYNSDFYRYRDTIDAAIISDMLNARLCVNTLSPNYERFIESPLARVMAKGVVDPNKLEKAGNAYIVDGDVDRSDKAPVLAYLQKKYGITKIMNLTMKYMSGTVTV